MTDVGTELTHVHQSACTSTHWYVWCTSTHWYVSHEQTELEQGACTSEQQIATSILHLKVFLHHSWLHFFWSYTGRYDLVSSHQKGLHPQETLNPKPTSLVTLPCVSFLYVCTQQEGLRMAHIYLKNGSHLSYIIRNIGLHLCPIRTWPMPCLSLSHVKNVLYLCLYLTYI